MKIVSREEHIAKEHTEQEQMRTVVVESTETVAERAESARTVAAAQIEGAGVVVVDEAVAVDCCYCYYYCCHYYSACLREAKCLSYP